MNINEYELVRKIRTIADSDMELMSSELHDLANELDRFHQNIYYLEQLELEMLEFFKKTGYTFFAEDDNSQQHAYKTEPYKELGIWSNHQVSIRLPIKLSIISNADLMPHHYDTDKNKYLLSNGNLFCEDCCAEFSKDSAKKLVKNNEVNFHCPLCDKLVKTSPLSSVKSLKQTKGAIFFSHRKG